MKFHKLLWVGSTVLLSVLLMANVGHAQLDQTFKNVFDSFLVDKIQLSGGFHGSHYLPAAELADSLLTPALNSLVAGNVSSFPLSSTVAGVTYDFSTGRPVSIKESLGPIFAETAETLGSGRLNVGVNYTYLNLVEFRGLSTRDMRFTFIHEDNEPAPDLGIPGYENDYIDLFLNLDVDAHLFALSTTLGVTNRLDIGFALPIVSISLSGTARAVITSYTFGRTSAPPQFQGASHRFNDDPLIPELEAETPYNESATGIGDVAIRMKYSFLRSANMDMAALVDVRLPTGKEEDFLGTGDLNGKIFWIMSRKIGDFTPHLNFGYDRRQSSLDSDEFEFILGFDQKVGDSGLTFAAELMGAIDVNTDEAIELFPGESTLVDRFTTTDSRDGELFRTVDLSNIPDSDNDSTVDVAFGFRYAPTEKFLFLGNVIIPVNDNGLRSSVAPTVGFTFNF